MAPKQRDADYSEKETQQRRDKALRAALSMAVTPRSESSGKKKPAEKRPKRANLRR